MKHDEKEKMMKELFGQKRDLSFGSLDLLNDTENELKRIIDMNQKTLNELSKKSDNPRIKKINDEIRKDFGNDVDLVKLQNELEEDLGVKLDVPETPVGKSATREVFEEINKELNELVLGQKEATKEMTIAFRRPYVTGYDLNKIRTSILLTGSNGSGRHLLVKTISELMKKHQLFTDDTLRNIDMSSYQSPSQENLFLQDLYVALTSSSPVIVIEHMEEGHALFNRMIGELVLNGFVKLNKRYIFKAKELHNTNDALSKDVIDSINGNNKILVFISENSPNKMLDVFGKSFMDKVVDKVKTKTLDLNTLDKIIDKILVELENKVIKQLETNIRIDSSIKDYLLNQYSPNDGVDSITPIIKKIYGELVELSLKKDDIKAVEIIFSDNEIKVLLNDETILLNLDDKVNEEKEAIKKELDEVVGLKDVKDYLLRLEKHIEVSNMRKKKGLKVAEISKHMIFTGNPGTGKTTIARLISRLMKASGILRQGQLVEVTRADLVAKYVGQTAPLTMDVIKSAMGGVLFIDEAYSLYRGKDDSFGLEAIDTLVKAMEDYRDDFIVILAGYSKEMEVFLDANSGLKSRFANIIHFKDYTGEELTLIAKSIAKSKDYRIDEEAIKPLTAYFDDVQNQKEMTSGNGRLARNIVEEAILNQSKRVLEDENVEIDLLKLEDFDLKGDL